MSTSRYTHISIVSVIKSRYLIYTYTISQLPTSTSSLPIMSVSYQLEPYTYLYCHLHKYSVSQVKGGTSQIPFLSVRYQKLPHTYRYCQSGFGRYGTCLYLNLPILSVDTSRYLIHTLLISWVPVDSSYIS